PPCSLVTPCDDAPGIGVRRIHRWPYGRAPVAAHIEDDADPMACGCTRGAPVGRHSADVLSRDSGAAAGMLLSMPSALSPLARHLASTALPCHKSCALSYLRDVSLAAMRSATNRFPSEDMCPNL